MGSGRTCTSHGEHTMARVGFPGDHGEPTAALARPHPNSPPGRSCERSAERAAHGIPLPRDVDLETTAGEPVAGDRTVVAQVGEPDAGADGRAPGCAGDLAGGYAVAQHQLTAPQHRLG